MTKCDICLKEFKNYHGVQIHKSRMHPDVKTDNDSVTCAVGGKTFVKERNPRVHQGTYSPEDHTHTSYGHRDKIKPDIKTDSDSVTCSVCGKTFEAERNLRIHHGRVHKGTDSPEDHTHTSYGYRDKIKPDIKTDSDSVTCSVCGKTFEAERNLRIHHGHVHKGIEFPGPDRGIKKDLGVKKKSLQRSGRMDVPEDFTLTSNGHHDQINTASGGQVACLFCDKTFPAGKNLRIHHGIKHKGIEFPGPDRDIKKDLGVKKESLQRSDRIEFPGPDRGIKKDLGVKKESLQRSDPVKREESDVRLKEQQENLKLAKKDISAASSAVNNFTDSFLAKLNDISGFEWKDFRSGSYYDKTKNDYPDEFDIMIYPKLQVSVELKKKTQLGFCKVKMVSTRGIDEMKNLIDEKGYILPKAFKDYAFNLFDKVLGSTGITEGRRTKKLPKSKSSPAYTILYDAIPGKPKIDIDLVPSFVIDGWPVEVAKRIEAIWVSSDQVVNDSMLSYDVVCKSCPEDIPDRNILWRLSFSKAEKKLLTYANSKDPSAFKKNALKFTKKCIQDLRESNPGKIKKFCSYHLKQFMFLQYDTWPEQRTSETCIQKCILENLIRTLRTSNPTIYSYFIPNDNVLKYIPREEIDLICKGLQEKVRTFF